MGTEETAVAEMTTADDRRLWWDSVGRDELRQLLYWRWDPIGVNREFPCTLDEYDRYADAMQNLAVSGADEVQLEAAVLRATLQAQAAIGFDRRPGAEIERRELTESILDWRYESIRMWKQSRA